MTDVSGRTALITGGASGIGLLMGEILLRKGLGRLIVWDMSDDNIAAAAERLGPRAEFQRIDVTDAEAVLERAAGIGEVRPSGRHPDQQRRHRGRPAVRRPQPG